MGDNKAIEIAGNYLLEESLRNRADKTEFSERDLVWEDFYSEVRGLGYGVYVNMQLHSCVVNTKDKRLIPIIQKYIEKFKKLDNNGDYNLTISYLEDIADKSITEYVIERFKNENTEIYGAKFRWGEVLLKTADPRYIDEYLNIVNSYVQEYLDGSNKENILNCYSIILLLSKLKVVEAIPILLKMLKINDTDVIFNCRYAIIQAFGNYKLSELRPYIEPFLTDKNVYTRNYAKAAIAKIERAEAKRNKQNQKIK